MAVEYRTLPPRVIGATATPPREQSSISTTSYTKIHPRKTRASHVTKTRVGGGVGHSVSSNSTPPKPRSLSLSPLQSSPSDCRRSKLQQISRPSPHPAQMASAKVDNRGSFGSKRSRNDGASRSDRDWTCPQCGNVNFSFRTECNRQQCRVARPSASPQRMGSTPVPGAFGHPTPPYYGGVGGSMSTPYGMSNGYGAMLPHPGMRQNYGLPMGAPVPYGLLSAYGPPGPMGGMGYGPGVGMSPYGFGFRGSPVPVSGPWADGALPDNGASRKRRGGPDGLSEGDWVCPKCDNVNFAFRTTCNIKKCGNPRPTPPPNRAGNKEHSDVPEGSWTCSKCNNLNYPFRTACNRKGCGSEKPASSN